MPQVDEQDEHSQQPLCVLHRLHAQAPKIMMVGGVSAGDEERAEASALFLEPLRWMEGVLGAVQGKLACPK